MRQVEHGPVFILLVIMLEGSLRTDKYFQHGRACFWNVPRW